MRELSALRKLLVPQVVGLVLDGIAEMDALIEVQAQCVVGELVCPDCSALSHRVHSCYERRLAMYPTGGRRAVIRLTVRRFFCENADCPRRTFVEQVEGLTTRFARAGPGVKRWWRSVALAVGGRPGVRLCGVFAMPTSRGRLLGLLHAPLVPDQAPRVLGVDDFAFRRSRTYGTVLIDVESSTVIDVLPDRTSETLAAWLKVHPGAEIVCRDRDSGYSRAVKEAAPHAREVADRWHLLQNLASAVEKTCHQHRSCLRKRADAETLQIPPQPPLIELPPLELPRTQIIERTRHRREDILRLVDAGWTISAIARRLHLDRKTVRRFRDTDLAQLLATAHVRRPAGVLEPFKPYINQRFTESLGQVSGSRLFLEVRERGYRGSRQVVRKHLAALRAGNAEPVRTDIPSPHKITGWIMRPREALTDHQDEQLLQVRLACPDITRACDLARNFADLVRHQRGQLLMDWIRQAEQDAPAPMRSFAGFLRQDLDAVTAGMTLTYSSGVVEGHINRLRRSSGRCTAAVHSNSSAPGFSCDRDRHEIPTRAIFNDRHQRRCGRTRRTRHFLPARRPTSAS
ncbi:ISL3 family transposase [Streptomyces sp. BA2]|uniref:ISL3 family transposase n=1 Tax=Streptomyces sp. BA2 TaxID=436595 RepID=UPI0013715AA9|nr:ISL3 family transposase [Streptomyces sp. BA2]